MVAPLSEVQLVLGGVRRLQITCKCEILRALLLQEVLVADVQERRVHSGIRVVHVRLILL